ncbi:MAG: peptidylprolyl isomerase [Oscillospiraceae bacterium]|nr:peptidylprolyl isomerase [Oscillospiraceae bacterium]
MRYRVMAALVSAMMLTAVTGCKKEIEITEKPILNYTAPAEGEEIVVIHVRDRGDVKIRLFPELLPEACENFTTHAKNGYYDELIFHRVIEGFMIQGGDPKGDGTGGESCWGGKFNGGVTEQLIHVPGALAYANSAGPATDGSQFYIVTGDKTDAETLKYYEEVYDQDPRVTYDINFTKEAEELYIQNGGAPHLDGGYTVFGQVIDGLDIVFEISQVPVNGSSKPKEAVYIDSITVESYDGSTIRWYKSDYGIQ